MIECLQWEVENLLRRGRFTRESESATVQVADGSLLEGMRSPVASEGEERVTSAVDHFLLRHDFIEHNAYLKRFQD